MAYLIYDRATGEIRSTAQNKVTDDMLPAGFAAREYKGDLSKVSEKRVTKSGKVVSKGAAHSQKAAMELARKAMIRRRNALLARSDWTQVPDAPVDQAAWRAYRQALRDLPSVTADPKKVSWPVPPA